MSKRIELADLIKRVALEVNDERASKCAYDCLLQWEQGHLSETMKVWEKFILDHKNNLPQTQTQRNGVWVPAIPL